MFFPLPNLSHFESERRNQKHTLSKKKEAGGGKGGCAYLLSCSVIYQSALPEAGARAPDLTVARTTPTSVLFITRSRRASAVQRVLPEPACSQRDPCQPGLVRNSFRSGGPFVDDSGDWTHDVLSFKHIQ